MVLAQHPATVALGEVLPPELCHLICQFAAPHAPPVINAYYQLVRGSGYEQLQVGPALNWNSTHQHITEYSPWGSFRRIREIMIKSSWSRERTRYGLDGRKGCLCWKFYLPPNHGVTHECQHIKCTDALQEQREILMSVVFYPV